MATKCGFILITKHGFCRVIHKPIVWPRWEGAFYFWKAYSGRHVSNSVGWQLQDSYILPSITPRNHCVFLWMKCSFQMLGAWFCPHSLILTEPWILKRKERGGEGRGGERRETGEKVLRKRIKSTSKITTVTSKEESWFIVRHFLTLF